MTEQTTGHAGPTPQQAKAELEQALFEIRRIIAGQDAMLERVLVCLLAQGHLLIEGVPGLAKTLTIKTTAGVLGGTFARVQFTPDLVPSDLVGTRIYRAGDGVFDTELGPVFCNFLLAAEINRAPAKVQSALLEVMQEHQVTIGHDTHLVNEMRIVADRHLVLLHDLEERRLHLGGSTVDLVREEEVAKHGAELGVED